MCLHCILLRRGTLAPAAAACAAWCTPRGTMRMRSCTKPTIKGQCRASSSRWVQSHCNSMNSTAWELLDQQARQAAPCGPNPGHSPPPPARLHPHTGMCCWQQQRLGSAYGHSSQCVCLTNYHHAGLASGACAGVRGGPGAAADGAADRPSKPRQEGMAACLRWLLVSWPQNGRIGFLVPCAAAARPPSSMMSCLL